MTYEQVGWVICSQKDGEPLVNSDTSRLYVYEDREKAENALRADDEWVYPIFVKRYP
jgi:hypothetical protein